MLSMHGGLFCEFSFLADFGFFNCPLFSTYFLGVYFLGNVLWVAADLQIYLYSLCTCSIVTFRSGGVLPSLLYRFLWVQKGQADNTIFPFSWQATFQPLRPCSIGWLFQLNSSFGMQQYLPLMHSCTCHWFCMNFGHLYGALQERCGDNLKRQLHCQVRWML